MAKSDRGSEVLEQTITLGGNKKARRVYGFDEVALAPSALSVDPRDVDASWELGKHRFSIPVIASALDAAVHPALAARVTASMPSAASQAGRSAAGTRFG